MMCSKCQKPELSIYSSKVLGFYSSFRKSGCKLLRNPTSSGSLVCKYIKKNGYALQDGNYQEKLLLSCNAIGLYTISVTHRKTKNHNCLLTLSLLGPPDIGKTSSIARLALKWVEGAKELRPFDFVFAIQLKYAHKASSLAELIKLQHDRLKVSECFYICST